jgi:hypothetical protein
VFLIGSWKFTTHGQVSGWTSTRAMKHRDLHRQTLILQVSLDAFFWFKLDDPCWLDTRLYHHNVTEIDDFPHPYDPRCGHPSFCGLGVVACDFWTRSFWTLQNRFRYWAMSKSHWFIVKIWDIWVLLIHWKGIELPISANPGLEWQQGSRTSWQDFGDKYLVFSVSIWCER